MAAPKKRVHVDARQAEWPLPALPQKPFQETIHADHWDERIAIIMALWNDPGREATKSAGRMTQCATTALLQADKETGKIGPNFFRCRQRLCPLCAGARSRLLTERFDSTIQEMKDPRILVLTVKHTPDPLRKVIANLKIWFAKLRRTPLWRSTVERGAYTIEVKRGDGDHQWHPHIHSVFHGKFLPWQQLRSAWHTITSGSEIVWLKPVTNIQSVARELAKYVSKPFAMDCFSQVDIREFFWATRGLRMFNRFGKNWPKAMLEDDPPEKWSPESAALSIPNIVHRANAGSEAALELAGLAANRWPILSKYIYTTIGESLPIRPLRVNPASGRILPLSEAERVMLDTAISQAYRQVQAEPASPGEI